MLYDFIYFNIQYLIFIVNLNCCVRLIYFNVGTDILPSSRQLFIKNNSFLQKKFEDSKT